MPSTTYRASAGWDGEAGVWVATSEEVPGLATEAPTLEALTEKLRILIPELLEMNHVGTGESRDELSFELVGYRLERYSKSSGSGRPRIETLHERR